MLLTINPSDIADAFEKSKLKLVGRNWKTEFGCCAIGAVIEFGVPGGNHSNTVTSRNRDRIIDHLDKELTRYTSGSFDHVIIWSDWVYDEMPDAEAKEEVIEFFRTVEPFTVEWEVSNAIRG